MEVEEAASEAVEIEHHEMRPFAGTEAHGSFMSTISTVSCRISYTQSAKIYLFVFIIITCIPLVICGSFTILFFKEVEHNIHGAVFAFFAGKPVCLIFHKYVLT